jgi:DNA (cytosine-5)-methyltransferase 1
MRLKVFDFFSGCGGTSAGLRSAGMDIVLGIDIDPDAQATFKANFPEANFLPADLTKTRSNKLKSYVDSCKTNPLLFCGCAPCQPFSKQNGSLKPRDSRRSLLSHFGRFVRYFKPDFVLIENVPGIQNVKAHRSPLGDFVKLLDKLKYKHVVKVVDCRDFGVPQTRKRLVLIACRSGSLVFPAKTHGDGTNLPYSTVWEWISGFPRIKAGQECKRVPNHRAAMLSKENLRRIRATPPGGSRRDWPRKLMLDCQTRRALISLVAFAVVLSSVTAVFCQSPVRGQLSALEITRKFLRALYPELADKQYAMCASTFAQFDQGWPFIPFLDVTVGRGSCDPSKDGSFGVPQDTELRKVLSGRFEFDANGLLVDVFVQSDSLLSRTDNERIRKVVDMHQDWSDQQVADALKSAGAKFGPDDRKALTEKIPVNALEPFIGKFQIESSEFRLRHKQEPTSLAELYWTVDGESTVSDGRKLHWSLILEPFEGRLTSLLGNPRER